MIVISHIAAMMGKVFGLYANCATYLYENLFTNAVQVHMMKLIEVAR